MLDQALRFLSTPCSASSPTRCCSVSLMQWLRAPFRNPLGQAVVALTDWAVKPMRRVVPGFQGLDSRRSSLAWLAQFLWLVALALVVGTGRPVRRHSGYVRVARMRRARQGDAVASHHRRVRAGDPVVGCARRSVRRRAERADVSAFCADPAAHPAARRNARSLAVDRDRARAARADAARALARKAPSSRCSAEHRAMVQSPARHSRARTKSATREHLAARARIDPGLRQRRRVAERDSALRSVLRRWPNAAATTARTAPGRRSAASTRRAAPVSRRRIRPSAPGGTHRPAP